MPKIGITKENIALYIMWILLALYSGWSLYYLLTLITGGTLLGMALFLPLFALAAFLLMLSYKDWKTISDVKVRNRRIRFSYFFSFLLAVSYVMGYQICISDYGICAIPANLYT